MDPRTLFAVVRRRPGLYMLDSSFDEAVAFVQGVDAGNAGCLLHGFKEWLLVTFDGSASLSWVALVLRAAFPETPAAWERSKLTAEQQKIGFDFLFLLLDDFFVLRSQSDGLRAIFERYTAWVRQQA
ncbi:hypothetical protein LZC95_24190 [Pendulispora brunnea]|uniref:Uncharacterized protein n=1 Tax=Pendulispora brunnea TaxID=2905690 RepID=A0ABZ2KMM4_9BACT